MRFRILVFILISSFLCSVSFSEANNEFVLIDKWEHDYFIGGWLVDAIFDKDNLIAIFIKSPDGAFVINEKSVSAFAPWGEGPGDLQEITALCKYKENIAVVEQTGRTQIFTKEGNRYQHQKILWLSSNKNLGQRIHLAHYKQNKWSTTGAEHGFMKKKGKGDWGSYCLRIFNDKGKLLKRMMKYTFPAEREFRLYMMQFFLNEYKAKILFIPEFRPEVNIINTSNLKVEQKINLKVPEFYKKMPYESFTFKKRGIPSLRKYFPLWRKTYSRIVKSIIVDNYLVIQMRTCEKNLKKFALLYYDISNKFKLIKTIFCDDLLLAYDKGKYYFFQNGNPGIDDGASQTIIKILKLRE